MSRIYCIRCLYPADCKPDLTFSEEGLCSACQAFDARSLIDWDAREADFRKVVLEARREAADRDASHDCIVPVSGGKDSHYQVLKAMDYGLRVLAVTAETDHLSDIGRRNLDNIAKLGCDHIEVKTNPVIRRRINRFTLETIGDISWAEHITIFSIPVRVASMMKIPLIIWGENPQSEYGGPAEAQKATELTQDWLNEFGGLNGLRIDDVEANLGSIGELNSMVSKLIILWWKAPMDRMKIWTTHKLQRTITYAGLNSDMDARPTSYRIIFGGGLSAGKMLRQLQQSETPCSQPLILESLSEKSLSHWK